MKAFSNVTYIGTTFPTRYSWGVLENQVIDDILSIISNKFSNQKNLFVNGTWFSPHINAGVYNEVKLLQEEFDNVFFLTTVDPPKMTVVDLTKLFQQFGNPKVHFLGNFDDSKYEFSFIAWAISKEFKVGPELELKEVKYNFINYNRKPSLHRVSLVKEILKNNLDHNAIVTLGKHCDSNSLHLSIDEKAEDFVETGHWYSLTDKDQDYGVPHDLLSLGNLKYWKHHFLNVVSETEFFPWDPIFVTEKTFKPIIGLRPFLLNGNLRTYKWLRKNGFKTFTHYFPFSNLEDTHEDSVVPNIIKALVWLDKQPRDKLLEMYNDMLPDLYWNRERFYEFAEEQKKKIDNLF
jgi:hypothetical protein